jgi:hypothetical protein
MYGVSFAFSLYVVQDLFHAADEVIRQGICELGLSGVDYYATHANQQGFYCCDELLVLMKDW